MSARFAFLFAALSLGFFLAGPAVAEEQPEHGAAAEHGEHAEHAEHGEEHEQEFNWSYGFLGEKEGVEPSLAYRPKGMPAPFLANLVNAAVLFAIIITAAKKPMVEGLKKRKERIVQGMEEAGKMKPDAEKRLAEYEEKLKHLDEEIERVKRDMREAAQAERSRLLAETKERRDRMERDARLLVEQELKAAREALVQETVAAAVRSAEQLVAKELGAADHDRIARDYLDGLAKAPLGAAGGRS